MKAFIVLTAVLTLSSLAHADQACSQNVQQAVQAKAAQDFPNETLVADTPDTSSLNGGTSLLIDVAVKQNAKVYATYIVDIGETCQIMGIDLKK